MWFCLFWGQLSICIDQVGWPQTCDPSVSVSQVLGLKGHKTTFGFNELFYTPFWADIYWMLSPLQHTLIGRATFPVCHSHLWPGTGILGSTMLHQRYTPNIHFPSPSSSSPVGTLLMTREKRSRVPRSTASETCTWQCNWGLRDCILVLLFALGIVEAPRHPPGCAGPHHTWRAASSSTPERNAAHMQRGRAQTGFPRGNPSGLQSLRCQKALPCLLLVWNSNGHFPDVKQNQQSSAR